jgi:hypothetical protein
MIPGALIPRSHTGRRVHKEAIIPGNILNSCLEGSRAFRGVHGMVHDHIPSTSGGVSKVLVANHASR